MSSTITRFSTPTCGAARPMPGAAYMVSSISSIRRRTSASTVSTGLDFFLRRGSGAVRMGKRAMTSKYAMKSGYSRPLEAARGGSVARHHRAHAGLGEDFQQQGMGHPSVHDGGGLDAIIHRIDAILDLGDHAARDRAVGDQGAGLVDRHVPDELAILVQDARHVGQEQEPLGPHGAGDGAG